MMHILVVDDDQRLGKLVQTYLVKQGYHASWAENAAQAEKLLSAMYFDLMVLDVMMPGEDGISFAKRLTKGAHPPILMLTARDDFDDRVAGFEAGVDDYLAKPFEPRELILRIEAILRRVKSANTVPNPEKGAIRFGMYSFDAQHGLRTLADGKTIDLTRNEHALLAKLAAHFGEPLGREILAALLEGGESERAVDIQIVRLRKKIESDPKKPQFIQTVRGHGYVLRGS